MTALYFNCRLTGIPLTCSTNYAASSSCIGAPWPISYPCRYKSRPLDQLAVLKKSIELLKNFSFSLAYFNIQIDSSLGQFVFDELEIWIRQNILADQIILNHTRPCTRSQWMLDTHKFCMLNNFCEPVLVFMNHDYFFVDYDPSAINSVIAQIFTPLPNYNRDANRVLAYAFPGIELFAEVARSESPLRSPFLRRDGVSTELGSIIICDSQLLPRFAESLCADDSIYIGRLLDWPGVKQKALNVQIFRYPREFFRHYDGFGLVTSMPDLTDLRDAELQPINLSNKSALASFLYTLWYDTYIIYVRDIMAHHLEMRTGLRNSFVDAVEASLQIFEEAQLVISEEFFSNIGYENFELLTILRSVIYSHATRLIQDIGTDIAIHLRPSRFSLVKRIIRRFRPI